MANHNVSIWRGATGILYVCTGRADIPYFSANAPIIEMANVFDSGNGLQRTGIAYAQYGRGRYAERSDRADFKAWKRRSALKSNSRAGQQRKLGKRENPVRGKAIFVLYVIRHGALYGQSLGCEVILPAVSQLHRA